MTTVFPSKEIAMNMACSFAGVPDAKPIFMKKIQIVSGVQAILGTRGAELFGEKVESKTHELYKLQNNLGNWVMFAVGKLRDGYDLWLVTHVGEKGQIQAMRV